MRAEIGPAEESGASIARRKKLYERKHPETKNGATGNGRKKPSQIATAAPAFIHVAAEKTGEHSATVALAATRGNKLGWEALAKAKGTSLDKGVELARCPGCWSGSGTSW